MKTELARSRQLWVQENHPPHEKLFTQPLDWLGLMVAMLPGKMNGTVRAEETAEDCTSRTRDENAKKRALW